MSNKRPGKQRRKERRAAERSLKSLSDAPAQGTSVTPEPQPVEPKVEKPSISQSATIEDNQPHDKRPTADEPNNEPNKGKVTGIVLRWLAASIGLTIVINHFSVRAWTLYIAAITICALLIWETRKLSRLRRWLLGAICVAVLFGTHWYVVLEHANDEKRSGANGEPNLQLQLKWSRSQTFSLLLTNKELFKIHATGISTSIWMLVVPVTLKDSSATLRLLVRNNSDTKAVNGFEVAVAFTDDLEVDPKTIAPIGGWVMGSPTEPHVIGLLDRWTNKLYPQRGVVFNDIGLKRKGGWTFPPKAHPLIFTLNEDDAPPRIISVELLCPVLPLPHEPYLVPPGGTYNY